MVIPVDGAPFAGDLVSLDADGLMKFRVPAEDSPKQEDEIRTLSVNELVRWSHPALPRPQTLVLLNDGSRLVTAADWSGGAAVQLERDTVVVRSDLFGEVRLPRRQVRGLVFANRRHPRDRQQLEDAVRAKNNGDDQVWLTNQDRLAGTVSELVGGSLVLGMPAGNAKLPLSRVEAVVFGEQGTGNDEFPNNENRMKEIRHSSFVLRHSLLLSLRDGSLLYAADVRASGSRLELHLAYNVRLAGGTVDDIASLQSLGGRAVYLSDMEPADYRHVPYLEITWLCERDRNVLTRPLAVGGKRYLKGLGMHSAARLTYRLDGRYRRFDAAVAIDDSATGTRRGGSRGSVVFGVYVLRDGQWQAALTSDIIRGGEEPQNVSADVTGAQGLVLTVDYADHGDELDHADWLDARLVK